MTRTRRGILYGSAVIVAAALPVIWLVASLPAVPTGAVLVPVAYAETGARPPESVQDELLALARRDPLELVRRGHERYERDIRDYRCVLVKQELIAGQLSAVQEVELRFCKSPLSIYMLWQRNADGAKRALYKDDPAFVDEQGNKVARVEPAGAIVRLLVKDLFMPIHGEQARRASRRSIDECGFGASFDLMERFTELGRANGVLEVRFAGLGEVDGRPTFVIERYLPYTGEGGVYPDAKLILHLDREWLLPVAVECFADKDGQDLLGRYAFTQVQLNPGLQASDFAF